MQRIVIVGGGFAGVWAALSAAEARRRARRKDIGIVLVSRDPWLTIRPRLYEPVLEAARVPLDEVLLAAGIERMQGTVLSIDPVNRSLVVDSPVRQVGYTRLVLAGGSAMQMPGIAGIENAFSVDTFAHASRLRDHIASLGSRTPNRIASRGTAVVIGAGFTGIEVATALISRLRDVGSPQSAEVILLERSPQVVPDLSAAARAHVQRALQALQIRARTGCAATEVRRDGVLLASGEWIGCGTVVLAGGFRASPLAAELPAERDTSGRLHVNEYLQVPGVEAVYAAGDIARAIADPDGGHLAPMSCQMAIPMGNVAGANACADIVGTPPTAFAAPHYVTCLDLGEAGALFMQGWDHTVTLSGQWAKLLKQAINGRLIYPPRSGARRQLARLASGTREP